MCFFKWLMIWRKAYYSGQYICVCCTIDHTKLRELILTYFTSLVTISLHFCMCLLCAVWPKYEATRLLSRVVLQSLFANDKVRCVIWKPAKRGSRYKFITKQKAAIR